MKRLHKHIILLSLIIFLLSGSHAFAQTAEKGNLSIAISYFVDNNKIPSVKVAVKTKVDGRFKFVGGIPLTLFLDKDSAGTAIGKVVTNDKGVASILIPPAVKKEWNTSVKHTFLAKFGGSKKYDTTSATQTVARAKILIDTASGRSIVATVMEMKDTTWTPVKGVDVIVGIRREGGDLLVNETPTFSTDSTGKISAEFKRDSIPGDARGNITLVAKIVDNDNYGNLSIEKRVQWGRKFTMVSNFNERTLFATRSKAPIWLLLMASSIIIAVWVTLVMLVLNILKIRKLAGEEV